MTKTITWHRAPPEKKVLRLILIRTTPKPVRLTDISYWIPVLVSPLRKFGCKHIRIPLRPQFWFWISCSKFGPPLRGSGSAPVQGMDLSLLGVVIDPVLCNSCLFSGVHSCPVPGSAPFPFSGSATVRVSGFAPGLIAASFRPPTSGHTRWFFAARPALA